MNWRRPLCGNDGENAAEHGAGVHEIRAAAGNDFVWRRIAGGGVVSDGSIRKGDRRKFWRSVEGARCNMERPKVFCELREFIAAENKVAVENVLITSGAQQALDLIGRVLIDAEDAVAVENPTYLALLSSWRVHRPAFEPVRSDAEGLDVGSMSHGAKMLYVVPNFQNPQGTTLSLRRREQLAAHAQAGGYDRRGR